MARERTTKVLARCGAAARRADLPVATLRVWERRYEVIGPERSAAGQRLYSEENVERLKVLKRVVDRGYAIGTVAHLSNAELESLAIATNPTPPRQGVHPLLRWAIVGQALRNRLAPLASVMKNHLDYEDLTVAMSELEPDYADVIILHSPSLREESTRLILEFAGRHPFTCIAAVYSYGVATAISQLRNAGVHLFRDPLSRVQLQQAVDELARSTAPFLQRAESSKLKRVPRLFNDSALMNIERRATSIACECPTHLTALISQLTAFEQFSDECVSANSRDAVLHRHIGDVASQARNMLEFLLQRMAVHEGLPLD